MRSSPCCRRPSARGAIRSSWHAPGLAPGSLPSSTSIRRSPRCPMRWCRDATPKGRAAMFPAISLTGLAGSQSAAFSDLLTSGTGIWSLGFALALPIFDAGRREAAVEQTEARRRQAARNALQLSNERYEAGYSPYLEVLDAQRTANEAELAFVRNRQARLAFSVDLMKALGGGWRAQ